MSGKQILLVEGRDDEYVVKSICGRYQIGLIENIKSTAGVEKLLEAVPVALKGSDISVLGVVLDADTDLTSRWQALVGCLVQAGYSDITDQPIAEGTIVYPPSDKSEFLPKVGIWVMPNNQIPGMLEDFLTFLIPDNDPLLAYAKKTLSDLPKQRFVDAHQSKALMHTWLAWQKEPGKPYGQAITACYLDSKLPLGEMFANWLKVLFFE